MRSTHDIARVRQRQLGQKRFRKLLVEALEERLVLAVANYDQVDSHWFDRPPLISIMGPDPVDLPSAQQQAALMRWVARLSPEQVENYDSVAEAAALIQTIAPQAHVRQGLGLPGQLLVVASERNARLVESQLIQSQRFAYVSRDSVFTAQDDSSPPTPTDPRLTEQYGLENSGDSNGTRDADVDALDAWQITRGSPNVVVAVLDSGIDLDHEDLAGRIWMNSAEIPGNQLDDDGNGYVDDVYGYNFRGRNGDTNDDNGHGTHVAGIIGARADNEVGGAGVAPEISLMPVKFLDANNDGFESEAAEAINYVTMMRQRGVDVRVINASWVSQSGDEPALREAIRAAGEADILFVTSAGNGNALRRANDNDIEPVYPANYNLPNLLSVAATDRNDYLAPFYNFGANSVQLAAPGLDILSTELDSRFGFRSGTSMAAAFVSGAAALYWSQARDASVTEVREAILAGVDRLPNEVDQERVATHGRLNVYQTLLTDTVAPHATLLSGLEPVLERNDEKLAVVRYWDNVGIALESIDTGDLILAREGDGASMVPVSVAFEVNDAGREVIATYRFAPSGSAWESSHNGKYHLTLLSQQIMDTSGRNNFVAEQSHLGRFVVDVLDPNQFRVNTPADTVDIAPGDGTCQDESGLCSLRAAIIESNAMPGANTVFVPAGDFHFNLTDADEDLALSGDLDILDDATIIGRGSGAPLQIVSEAANVVAFVDVQPLQVDTRQTNLGFEKSEDGSYRLILPEIHIPLINPEFIQDGEWFGLLGPDSVSHRFEFDSNGIIEPDQIPITFSSQDDAFSLAASIAATVNNQFEEPVAEVRQSEIVVIGNFAPMSGLESFDLSSRTRGAILDGQIFSMGAGELPIRFEFDGDGHTEPGNIAVSIGTLAKSEKLEDTLRRVIAENAARISDVTILDARSTDRVLDIGEGVHAELRNMAVVHGKSVDADGGGIRHQGANLTLTDMRVADSLLGSDDFQLDFARVAEVSTNEETRATDVAIDQLGNLYSIGYYKGFLDLDASKEGPALPFANSFQTYLAKFRANGELEWAFPIEGSESLGLFNKVDVDEAGDLIVSGSDFGLIDFDLSANGVEQIEVNQGFVAKYHPNGELVWARSLGVTPFDLAVGGSDVFVNGQQGSGDNVVVRFNTQGVEISRITVASGASSLRARGLAIASDGSLYVTGSFSGTIDVDPSSNVYEVTGEFYSDTYVVKLTPFGELDWVKTFSSDGEDWAKSIKVSATGDIYLLSNAVSGTLITKTGQIEEDFQIHAGDFVVKMTADGSIIWLKEIVGAYRFWNGEVALDPWGNIALMGAFDSRVDLDPGPGEALFTLDGLFGNKVYVAKWNSDGEYIQGYSLGRYFTLPGGLAVDSQGAIAISGESSGPVDFHPSPFEELLINVNDTSLAAFITKVKLSNSTAISQAEVRGVGIFATGDLEIRGGQISGNVAISRGGSRGGGIYSSGNTHLVETVVRNNKAQFGGGIALNGVARVEGTTVHSNTAYSEGGGIWLSPSSDLGIDASTISNNTAVIGGGLASSQSTWSMDGSTLSGNLAREAGGGIHSRSDRDVQLLNTTLSDNSASDGGGVLWSDSSGTMFNSTLFGNRGETRETTRAIELRGMSVLQLANTIVSARSDASQVTFHASDIELDTASELRSLGHNLVAVSPAGILWDVTDHFGDSLNPLDMKLGPLQNNGGVVLTHAPLFSSPAIDSGSNDFGGTTSANGLLRPIDGDADGTGFNDIGAAEAYYGDLRGRITRDPTVTGAGLAGWIVYLDQNQNDLRDPGERFTATDQDGNYSFGLVPPGTYFVREESRVGWEQTFPQSTYSLRHEFRSTGEVVASHLADMDNDGDTDLVIATKGVKSTSIASADVPVTIPDAYQATSTIDVDVSGALVDVNVRLNISHSFAADLLVDLISPNGTYVRLINKVGGKGPDFDNLLLDDEASSSVVGQLAPVRGTFRPEEALSFFDGTPVHGTWTLRITDTAEEDSGNLLGWELELVTATTELRFITNTQGAFAETQALELGAPVIVMADADVNGDGTSELLIGQRSDIPCGPVTSCAADLLSVISFDEGAGWSNVHEQAIPPFRSIHPVDMNRDGLKDLILEAAEFPFAFPFMNRGDGFELAAGSDLLSPPLAVGDFNGDGLSDLIVHGTESGDPSIPANGLAIQYALLDGAYLPPLTIASNDAQSVLAADFNGDDSLDLLTAHSGSGAIAFQTPLVSPHPDDIGVIRPIRFNVPYEELAGEVVVNFVLEHVAGARVVAQLSNPHGTADVKIFDHVFAKDDSDSIRLTFGDLLGNTLTPQHSFHSSDLGSFASNEPLASFADESASGEWFLALFVLPDETDPSNPDFFDKFRVAASLEFRVSETGSIELLLNDGLGVLSSVASVSSTLVGELLPIQTDENRVQEVLVRTRTNEAGVLTIDGDSITSTSVDLRKRFQSVARIDQFGSDLVGLDGDGNLWSLHPAELIYEVPVRAGEVLTELDFANSPVKGAIRGTVFHDIDTDGRQSAGELGLPDWRVYVDVNNNAQRDSDEPVGMTNEFGDYIIPEVAPERSLVRIELEDGWSGTLPSAAELLLEADFINAEGQADDEDFQFDSAGAWQLVPSLSGDDLSGFALHFGRETPDGLGQLAAQSGRVMSPVIDLTHVRGSVVLDVDQFIDLDPQSIVSAGLLTRNGLIPLPNLLNASSESTHTRIDLTPYTGGPVRLLAEVRPTASATGLAVRSKELPVELKSGESYFITVVNSAGQTVEDYRIRVVPELPDLTLPFVQVLSQTAEKLSVSAQIENAGNIAAKRPDSTGGLSEDPVIYTYFSRDARLDSDDLLANSTVILASPLAPNESQFAEITTNLTVDLNAFPYLLFSVDGSRIVQESNDANNVYALRVGNVSRLPDPYEPNEFVENAKNLGPIASLSQVGLSIHSSTDRDWYAFQPVESGDFQILMVPDQTGGDIDMKLYDEQSNLIASSAYAGTRPESISAPLIAGATYYIEVFSFSGTANYRLYLDAAPVAPDRDEPNDTLNTAVPVGSTNREIRPSLSIDSSQDVDYYSLHALAGFSYVVEIAFDDAQGNLDMRVVDENGAILEESATEGNREQITLLNVEAQTLYIEVRGRNGSTNSNYQLTLARLLGKDSLEPNDAFEVATPLLSNAAFYVGLTLHDSQDRDVFQLEPTRDGRYFISTDFLSQSSDVNLFVSDSEGHVIASTLHRGLFLDNIVMRAEGGIPVNVLPGSTIDGVLIGIESLAGVEGVGRLGSLSGYVYRDANSDRSHNDEEPGDANRKVFLDNNRNGLLDTGEAFTFTDSSGKYEFRNLAPGQFTVALESPERAIQTYPVDNRFDVIGAIATGDKPQSVVLRDFDADERLDIAAANSGTGSVSIRLRDENDLYTKTQDIPTGAGATWVAAGDWDGDGIPDLAVANMFANSVSLLANRNATFSVQTTLVVPAGPTSVAIAQLNDDNHDGRRDDLDFADLVVTTLGLSGSRTDNGGRISVFYGTAHGVWGTPVAYSGGIDPYVAVIAQLNDDNGDQQVDELDVPDIVAVSFGDGLASGGVIVLHGSPNGTFTSSSIATNGRGSYSLTAADLTKDGLLELIVVNALSQSVTVLVNRDGNTFVPSPAFAVGKDITSALAADMDGDNDLDVALSSGGLEGVAILRNEGLDTNGDLRLQLGAVSGAGDIPDSYSFGVASGNLDNDDIVDLAVAKGNSDKVVVLRNQIVPISREVLVLNRENAGVDFGSLVLNGVPTLGLLPPIPTLTDNPLERTFVLTGISDGDPLFDDSIRVVVQADHPDWFTKLSVDPPSADGTALLHVLVNGNGAGTAQLQVFVEDAGVDGLFAGPTGQELDNFKSPVRGAQLIIEMSRDFSDAPGTYGGAIHLLGGPWLGATVDAELTNVIGSLADGDGADDDGVILATPLISSTLQPQRIRLDLLANGARPVDVLQGWIDWNQDGDWLDAGEQVFADQPLAAGLNSLTLEVPRDAQLGKTYARFRISSQHGLTPNNMAPDGEVEDYQMEVVDAPPLITPALGDLVFVEDSLPLELVSNWSFHDDSSMLTRATLRLTEGYQSEQDILSFTPIASLQTHFDRDLGMLEITGAAPADDFQQVLRSIRYQNSSQNPSAARRVLELMLDDGRSRTTISTAITVQPSNDPPVIAPIENQTTSEGVATSPLSVVMSDEESALQQLVVTTLVVASQPDTLVTPANVSVLPTATGYSIVVTPTSHQSGTATLRVLVTDPEGGNAQEDFVVVVEAVNDSVTIDPIADQTFDEDVRHNVTITGISAGPGESQPIELHVTTDRPQLFSDLKLTYASPEATAELALAAASNQSGDAAVFVTVTDGGLDGDLQTSDDNDVRTLSFSVHLLPVNDPPEPNVDQYEVKQGELLEVPVNQGVLINDRNVDPGDRLTAKAGSIITERGATVLLDRNGSFLYAPADRDEDIGLGVGESLTDSFEYVVVDTLNATATGVVRIRIQGQNDPPETEPDIYESDEDSVLVIPADTGLLRNDRDPDATDRLTVVSFDATSIRGASIRVAADGSFRYDPNTEEALRTIQALARDKSLVDSFVYTVDDGHGELLRSAAVFVTIHGVNDWINPRPNLALDVNDNGTVEPFDALIVINTLNNPFPEGARKLVGVVGKPESYFDTNDDGFVSAADVLRIIDHLNGVRAEGEGTRVEAESPTQTERVPGTVARLDGPPQLPAAYFATSNSKVTNRWNPRSPKSSQASKSGEMDRDGEIDELVALLASDGGR